MHDLISFLKNAVVQLVFEDEVMGVTCPFAQE